MVAHDLVYRQMAYTHEKVEYLSEARKTYGDSTPPFTEKGLAIAQTHIKVRLLDDRREYKPVIFRAYKTPLDDLYYATVRLDGHAYIIKSLHRGWSQGDSTQSHPDYKYWYVWQGPRCHFRGPQFDGPVVRSVGRANPGNGRRVASMPERTSSSLTGNDSTTLSDCFIVSSSPVGGSQPLRLPQSLSGSTNPLNRIKDHELEDFTMAAFMTEIQAPSEHGYGPQAASRPPVPDENPTPTLTGEEMDRTSLGLWRGHNTDSNYVHMRLGEVKPKDGSPLTMEALFEKITKVFPIRNKNFFLLRWAFVEGPVNPDLGQPKPDPTRQLIISREAEQSWDDFLSDLRKQIREHGVQGWHVRINAYSV